MRDRVFQIALVGLVTVLPPYLVPILSEDQRWWWDNIWANLTLYGTALLAVLAGVGQIVAPTERRFWRFLRFAMASVLVVYLSWAIGELAVPTWLSRWAWNSFPKPAIWPSTCLWPLPSMRTARFAYVLALPLIHFLFYSADLLDPELRVLREVVVLSVLLLVGGLAVLYERKVRRANQVTHEELQAS